MSRRDLLENAAQCYEAAKAPAEAARCYYEAGAYRQAAALYTRLDMLREAAAAHAAGGRHEDGAWLLVHRLNDPEQARVMLAKMARERGADPLAANLVLARCRVAEDGDLRAAIPLLATAAAALANRETRADQRIEDWSVALATAAHRYDQAALIFAASVRGRRRRAADRWAAWSQQHLGTGLPPYEQETR
ncbi:hypothetical protein ACTOB_003062 [Actinoplanes oblitus]|uniref:Tetratricopeptide repeat protein n=1 Tax=Actinoplanes oblitus TaxID=3040509 RepID=A0ABY8WNH2_9ACTN|nr:hypothetical protein [Actinoplanes oblitus]WIM99411.1 hypothetical protein ACTOB_003062 [Actinoplanes oblitus]